MPKGDNRHATHQDDLGLVELLLYPHNRIGLTWILILGYVCLELNRHYQCREALAMIKKHPLQGRRLRTDWNKKIAAQRY